MSVSTVLSLSGYTPSFPDIPNVAGVPSVQRVVQAAAGSLVNSAANVALGAAQQAVSGLISNVQSVISNGASSLVTGAFGAMPTLLGGDSASVTNAAASSNNQWGVFDSTGTSKVLDADSFVAMSYKQSWSVSNFPMENGAFQSYNKVQQPFDVKVTLTKGGKTADLQSFLSSLDALATSFDLYQVQTPAQTYADVTVTGYDYSRSSSKGVSLLTVELSFVQINLAPTQTFTNIATPQGQDAANTGIVQPTAITDAYSCTESSVTSAVTGGASVASAIQAGTSVSSNLSALAPGGVSSVLATLTPASSSILNAIGYGTVSPISNTVVAQAASLLKVN
jgi:hypothetical protein